MAYPVAMETPAALPRDIWEQTPPEVQAYIGTLEARVAALEAMVQALQEQNRTLQEQLNQTSRNSSRPPSSDPPQSHVPIAPGATPSWRSTGPSWPDATLIPVEEVDEVVAMKPEQCRLARRPYRETIPSRFVTK